MKLAIVGKGGVGKTTLAAVLARRLASLGRPVIAVDADPDGNLAAALGVAGKRSAATDRPHARPDPGAHRGKRPGLGPDVQVESPGRRSAGTVRRQHPRGKTFGAGNGRVGRERMYVSGRRTVESLDATPSVACSRRCNPRHGSGTGAPWTGFRPRSRRHDCRGRARHAERANGRAGPAARRGHRHPADLRGGQSNPRPARDRFA